MLTYAKLVKTPGKFQRFTGLTVEEFNQLAEAVERWWKASERTRLISRTRQRVVGGGGQYKLETFKDKLLVPLMYYRLDVTYRTIELDIWGPCVESESPSASFRASIGRAFKTATTHSPKPTDSELAGISAGVS
ncbi:MAG: hypothetical protein KME43_10450 [Myxacorys chilensis ATA2-1-KO14]|jgi:hypothetical protein|nr:hypothetical protein [Myxacorys chilensis ATA2-1-KO14]